MNKPVLISIALLAAALPARGAISVRLERADEQPESIWPYRAAKLTIRNDSQKIIRAVHLRWRRGGPRFIHPVAIAPHTTASLAVNLPAAALEQAYQVALLDADDPTAAPAAELAAEIDWQETKYLTTEAFIDRQAYKPWEDNIPTWPDRLRRNVLLGAVLYCLALAGCLFIRRRSLRVAAVVLLAAAASIGIWQLLSFQELIFQREVVDDDGRGTLVVLTCRRTTQWHDADSRLAPIYYSERQMAEDTLTVHAARGVRLTIKPGQVRLLRRP